MKVNEKARGPMRALRTPSKIDPPMSWCPYDDCSFCGSDDAVDDHRIYAHRDEPQAGSNLRNRSRTS
jgi:hypothetical protein